MASYPTEFCSSLNCQPDFFKCQKSSKEVLLFGTYHTLPLSIIPSDYLEIMKTAKTLFLEADPRKDTLNYTSAKERDADLIARGFISEKPQGEDFETQLSQLDPKADQILKLLFKQGSIASDDGKIPLNRIKLDRLFWLCYFEIQVESMESGLAELFSPDKIFGLDLRSVGYTLPLVPIEKLNEFLLRNFTCVNGSLKFSSEYLEGHRMHLQGSTLARNVQYSNTAENDKVMLADRNRAWVKILASHLEAQYTGPVLVAVGHTHLVGRQGLLCLLQNEGYTISQYKPPFKPGNSGSTGFEAFEPNLLFKRHAEQFVVQSILNTLDIQLQNIFGVIDSEKYKINSLVRDYACSWPTLVFSDVYPDTKTVADSTMILANVAADANKTSSASSSKPK